VLLLAGQDLHVAAWLARALQGLVTAVVQWKPSQTVDCYAALSVSCDRFRFVNACGTKRAHDSSTVNAMSMMLALYGVPHSTRVSCHAACDDGWMSSCLQRDSLSGCASIVLKLLARFLQTRKDHWQNHEFHPCDSNLAADCALQWATHEPFCYSMPWKAMMRRLHMSGTLVCLHIRR
jgi:hypothetical protein